VRVARPDDLPAILGVERASFAAPWTERMFAEELRNDWSHVWVAEAPLAAGPVGFTVFWVAFDEVHILNIAVAPAWRRRGIARELLRQIIGFSEMRTSAHIVLEVRPSNVGAIRLYQSFRFVSVGVRPRYYADNGEDALVMVRTL
jgi:ribosomal-protein-alanine N-acetyltransferase